MNERERVLERTQVVTENPLEGEQLFLDAMFGLSEESNPEVRTTVREEEKLPMARRTPSRPVIDEPVVGRPAKVMEPAVARRMPAPKPQHYKIVSISLYNEDIERLNNMVRELKRRGHYKANKSQLIRHALARLDLDEIPRDL